MASEYVVKTINKSNRSLMAKFRTGILQLGIETGRYTNLKPEERVCQICNEGFIEDELHFLCVCSKYNSD